MTRAKFIMASVTTSMYSDAKQYRFMAVSDNSIPENERFTKYNPSGSLEMSVDNPAIEFKLGKSYYLDFMEAD